uniref:Fork-head domain-containing protein n=1 Tax=Glossina brevipalpis TaxID=37001 RepID=A0A1A9W607_9MUSC
MFELEDYSGSFHEGFLNKYADSSGPTLDFYISDSLQDMLDVDIRTEIANVVNSRTEYDGCSDGFSSSFDHINDSYYSNNHMKESSSLSENSTHLSSPSTAATFGFTTSTNSSAFWFGSSNDFYADVGACVNPISVMPLVSSSLAHMTPKVGCNTNGVRQNTPSPSSPSMNDAKSHLTFSPAHMKVKVNSLRNEQLTSHIPKQIVAISSTVTSATTAPATLATNTVLQRKNVASVEAVKKDLGGEMRKLSDAGIYKAVPCSSTLHANTNNVNSDSASASTIKLGPGIGSLSFANNLTFNKIKQDSALKSSQSASAITANGSIVLKRERDSSSPLHHAALNSPTSVSQHVAKLLSRQGIQSSAGFTPKSIASNAHTAFMQQHLNGNSAASSASESKATNFTTTISGGIGTFSTGLTSANTSSTTTSACPNIANGMTVKSLQQKIKATPIESEYPKPAYSYSCLIAMALKNSRRGSLPVSEIYSFMCEHFPYFKTAPSGWKNSVRHNLSLNKCFEKIEKPPTNGYQRKGCLWAMNPERITKMDEEVQKWSRKDPMAIRNAMVCPDNLEALERGEMKHGSTGDSDGELDSQSEIEETSDLEEQELDETLVDNMLIEDEMEDEEGLNSSSLMSNNIVMMSTSDLIQQDNFNNDSGGDVSKPTSTSYTSESEAIILTNTTTASGKVNNQTLTSNANATHNFDNEVEDIYDTIDIEDDKDDARLALNQSDIIELNPADYNTNVTHDENHQSPKRARLNVSYTIASVNEKQPQQTQQQQQQQQTIQLQNVKKIIKVQNAHDLQQLQQQLQQQQIIVQKTLTNGLLAQQQQQQQQLSATISTNRRKMQLVNRII